MIPGVGQIYNEDYNKAIGFWLLESYSIYKFNAYSKQGDKGLGKRNTYAWWIVGLFFWNILDAYVDAQISTFPSKTLESNYVLDTLAVNYESLANTEDNSCYYMPGCMNSSYLEY